MWTAAALLRRLAWVGLALITSLSSLPVSAQDDPPGRVGRMAELQGRVSIYDNEQGEWVAAARNRPLTQGDRLSTDADGRAALRIGSTTVRLGGGSELEVLRLDDERVQLQLHAGALALRLRSRETAAETDVVTAEARLRPQRSGHYRIDRIDDTTVAGSWRGELAVGGDGGAGASFVIDTGRRAEVWRDGSGAGLRHSWVQPGADDFGAWAQRADLQDEQRSASSRYVSPEMTGAEELDANGRWEQHPEHGAVWLPLTVRSGWAPYREGHWAWVRPWGWTWVDDAPWGFAPFHYGRWVSWNGRWGWTPGSYVARPVYAPALVAWIGGPHIGVSIGFGGGPTVGWVPLAPREHYVPYYRASPRYRDRVNHRPHHPPGHHRPPEQVPTGPIMYGNQGVPGGVTVVPRDVLVRREPVARAAIDLRDAGQRGGWRAGAPAQAIAAPAGPVAAPVLRAMPAPGRPWQQPQAPTTIVPGGAEPVSPRGQQWQGDGAGVLRGRDSGDGGDGRDGRNGRREQPWSGAVQPQPMQPPQIQRPPPQAQTVPQQQAPTLSPPPGESHRQRWARPDAAPMGQPGQAPANPEPRAGVEQPPVIDLRQQQRPAAAATTTGAPARATPVMPAVPTLAAPRAQVQPAAPPMPLPTMRAPERPSAPAPAPARAPEPRGSMRERQQLQ